MPNLRQVHLIPSELLETLRAERYEFGPGDLGENVLTAGLDLEILPLGTILKLGARASIELTGLRTPCVLIDRFRPGLKREMIVDAPSSPRFRCGVMAVVRSGGRVSVGDAIDVELPSQPLSISRPSNFAVRTGFLLPVNTEKSKWQTSFVVASWRAGPPSAHSPLSVRP